MEPLTVGNVVSTGLRIYRDRFVDYYKLAFFGSLWGLIPIYGVTFLNSDFDYLTRVLFVFLWFFVLIYSLAKYLAIMGLISRLAFGDITEKPESIKDAQRFIKPRMWSFFGAGLLVALIFIVAIIILAIFFSITSGIFGAIVTGISNAILTIIVGILLILAISPLFLFSLTWLISRILIVEVPLAIEENINATDAISRSWELTKGSIFRLQLIVVVGFLISYPITILIQIATTIIQRLLEVVLSSNSELFSPLLFLSSILLSIAGLAVLIPFWQSIKAVIYYDLRVRREGLGLNLEKS